jgi:carbamoyltransferase
MNILGYNANHHGSICFLQDGEIKYFIQEERISKDKYAAGVFSSILDFYQGQDINYVACSHPSTYHPLASNCPLDGVSYICDLVYNLHLKFGKPKPKHPSHLVKEFNASKHHHVSHAAHAFYNSGFKESIGIVIDGLGSIISPSLDRETETIFHCSYPDKFVTLYRNQVDLKSEINLSRMYETITMHLGWVRDEAGKTMGLAPYGKQNLNFPNFFYGNIGNPNVFYYDAVKGPIRETFINEEKNPQLKLPRDPKEWHYNESKITDLEKDLAWKIQNDTQQLVGDYIEKAIQETGLKQVCCAGGYFLNCVTNYYLVKRFPDIEFYFEPIANDSGTAIGVAKLAWHTKTKDTTIRPFKSLYLGKQYSKEELLEGIKKYI